MLIAAFVRALKDPFPPARNAALLALTATQQYHRPMDVATKVLPHIAPIVLDAERDVRATAIQCLRVYVGKLETASAKVGQPPEAQGEEDKSEIALATDKVLDSVSWLSGAAVSKLTAAVSAAGGGDKGGGGGGGGSGGGEHTALLRPTSPPPAPPQPEPGAPSRGP